jgi:hypothetical protein
MARLTPALKPQLELLLQHFALEPGANNPNELPDQPHMG